MADILRDVEAAVAKGYLCRLALLGGNVKPCATISWQHGVKIPTGERRRWRCERRGQPGEYRQRRQLSCTDLGDRLGRARRECPSVPWLASDTDGRLPGPVLDTGASSLQTGRQASNCKPASPVVISNLEPLTAGDAAASTTSAGTLELRNTGTGGVTSKSAKPNPRTSPLLHTCTWRCCKLLMSCRGDGHNISSRGRRIC